MTLVDPAPFLQKVDRDLYGALTRKHRTQTQIDLSGVLYTEPQILMHQAGDSRADSSYRTPAVDESEWIISSKVQNIGNFIDTDAVKYNPGIGTIDPILTSADHTRRIPRRMRNR